MAGPEHQDPPRQDRHLFPGLGVAPDPLTLLTHGETAEGGNLDHLSPCQSIRNLVENTFHKIGGFVAREADFLIDRLAQLRSCDGVMRHGASSPLPLGLGQTVIRRDKSVNYKELSSVFKLLARSAIFEPNPDHIRKITSGSGRIPT